MVCPCKDKHPNAGDKQVTVEEEQVSLPEITEESVNDLAFDQRRQYALLFKNEGNKTYSARKFQEAIELYTKAILCHADPVFYSNRAACTMPPLLPH
jgi:import receptor subunit TOM70